jgi:Outer membrane protein beta-barrel domain
MQRALVLLALLATVAGSLPAQTVYFTPRLGVFVPTKNLLESIDPGSGLLREDKATTKFNIGARLGLWFGNSFGLEGVVDYNTSAVQTFIGGARQQNLNSNLVAASLRPAFRLTSSSGNVSLILSAGGGLVDRGGDYINGSSPPATQFTGRTDLAGAAGVGLTVKLSRWVAARFDVDGYTYIAQYASPGAGSTSSLRQYDLFITFGLTGPFRNYGLAGE